MLFDKTSILMFSCLMGQLHSAPSSYDKMISMPLVDNVGATLKADLDVTKMNRYLHEYIQQEVSRGVSTAMAGMVETMVENKTRAFQTELEAKIVDKMKQLDQKDKEKHAFFAHLSSEKENLID
ncbi:uncharacterized protein LOC134714077 [Mytilus trossulus]|uniref:uncharacterized protein LOC134714077 n=1 Tax=Mytilus trossulus TaxID=6551 RepID=UPI003004B269